MEDKLQRLFEMRNLQNQVIVLRTDGPSMYKKMIKKDLTTEMKRLLNVKINLPSTEICIPQHPQVYSVVPSSQAEKIVEECTKLNQIYDIIH